MNERLVVEDGRLMVELVRKPRPSHILTPSRIPCLRGLPTINITEGCSLGCVYCYIQGYSGYPGPGRVILFDNTAELVAAELARKRRLHEEGDADVASTRRPPTRSRTRFHQTDVSGP